MAHAWHLITLLTKQREHTHTHTHNIDTTRHDKVSLYPTRNARSFVLAVAVWCSVTCLVVIAWYPQRFAPRDKLRILIHSVAMCVCVPKSGRKRVMLMPWRPIGPHRLRQSRVACFRSKSPQATSVIQPFLWTWILENWSRIFEVFLCLPFGEPTLQSNIGQL